jgi:SAM-dependent methyltransferase
MKSDAAAHVTEGARCPLCGDESFAPSWLRATRHEGKEFHYAACRGCHSLYCRPMPDARDLESMYGTSYALGTEPNGVDDPKDPDWVVEWLDRLEPGTFVDYGCGTGVLLAEARRHGWEVRGVELTDEVVEETSRRTGLPVVSVDRALDEGSVADVIHLGDVLEHLTDLDREMPRILSLLKDGGLLLAQGPLEANGNLFTWVLRLSRGFRRKKPPEMPPYRVTLATRKGQWALFRRFGLTAVEESLDEVSWPAPARLSTADLLSPRRVGLFALRVLSKSLSRFRRDQWGNRYRYAGRINETASTARSKRGTSHCQPLIPTAHQ